MDKELTIIILEDDKNHFKIIKKIITDTNIAKISSKFIYNFEENKDLISSYINYKHTGINSEKIYKSKIEEKIKSIPRHHKSICIIDVNWGYSDNDHLGIDFYKDFLLDLVKEKNTIMTSILERSELNREFEGVKFQPKTERDSKGEIQVMGAEFRQKLIDDINALPAVTDISKDNTNNINRGANV